MSIGNVTCCVTNGVHSSHQLASYSYNTYNYSLVPYYTVSINNLVPLVLQTPQAVVNTLVTISNKRMLLLHSELDVCN